MIRISPMVLTLALAATSAAPPASAQSLSEAQVACDRARLAALVARTSVLGLDGQVSPVVQSLLFGYSNPYGFYEGLVVGMPRFRQTDEPPLPGFGPGPEHQLAFHLDPSVRELLLNPERPPLAQVSMTREISSSSLVDPGRDAEAPFAVQVRLRPTLGPGSAADAGDLVIDNLAAPTLSGEGFRPADTKPGRGLVVDGLTEPCHTLRSEIDRRVFAILQRTLRVELFDLDRGLGYDTRIVLFRDREPGIYGADVYAVDPETGELLDGFLHLLLEAHPEGTGALRDGRLLVGAFDLPGNPPVEGTVSIVRPLFGGVETVYEPVVSAPVSSPPAESQDLGFDWAEVLDGTAWNAGVPSGSSCGHGTAEEIAATPRPDPSTELLALSIGDALTADPATYERLVRDLAAIRDREPAVDGISIFPTTDAKSVLVTVADAATYEAIGRGEYHEWDCLNDWYVLEHMQSIDPVPFPTSLSLRLQLEGLYALETVAEDYAALDGIASASPLVFPLPGAPAGTLPSLCAEAVDGGVFRYFFDAISDVPAGGFLRTYYFTTSEDGAVTFEGVYDPFSAAPPPPWLPLVDACYAHLRYGTRV